MALRGRRRSADLAIIRLATTYGRYGYRRITALLRADCWRVNLKRVYRIWRREGLKVPPRPPLLSSFGAEPLRPVCKTPAARSSTRRVSRPNSHSSD
jgi:transposase InsO family protein